MMDYSKFHMTYDIMLLCLQANANARNISTELNMHRTVGIVLAYLNCHVLIVVAVAIHLVGRLTPDMQLFACLFATGD